MNSSTSSNGNALNEFGPRDPFAMLLDPDRVVREMEHSERLQRLQRRVCHPLDLPSMSRTRREASADFDRMVDESPEEPLPELIGDDNEAH